MGRRRKLLSLWRSNGEKLGRDSPLAADIDYRNTSFLDHTGRPMPILPYGEPIAALL
jgi:hypothetical protein